MSPDSSAPDSPVERLHRLEHAVEDAVEHAVVATERSLARRFGLGCVRTLRWSLKAIGLVLLIGYFVSGLSLLAARYWLLPRIDEARPWIERQASRALGTRVTIGRIDAAWRTFSPVLNLREVRLHAPDGDATLELPRVEATIAWATAPLLWIRFESLLFVAPELEVRRLADGRYRVAGFTFDPARRGGDGGALDWLLTQQRVGIRDGRLRYIDETRPAGDREVRFDALDFELRNGVTSHRFALRGRPPSDWSAPVDLRGDFDQPLFARPSDLAQWEGRLYAQSDFVNLARVAAFLRLRAADERIVSADGALRLWATIEDARLLRLTADVALADVSARLGSDVEPLQVRRLQGRLTQQLWGNAQEGGQQIELGQLSFSGAPGATAPLGQLRLRTTRATATHGARGELAVSALELAAVRHLVPGLPLPLHWREALARWPLGGRIPQLEASWEEERAPTPTRYALRARFDALTLPAQPAATDAVARPGFAGLAGSIELNEAGGTLRLAAPGAALEFPGVFEQPRLDFERLDAVAHWTLAPQFELRVESLAARNTDLELSAQGRYRRAPDGGGPGLVELEGRLPRLAIDAAWRYVPLAAGRNLRAWLRDGLVSGVVRDAQFTLHGDLAQFPWPDSKSGRFRAAGRLEDGVIDYQAGDERDAAGRARPGQIWPLLQGVQADFVFQGNSMELRAREARSYGLRVSQVTARIPDMAHDARLAIRGSGGGPLADLLRLVNGSPIARWIHGATNRAQGSGNARFDLDLDIPLGSNGGETRARGAVRFAGNDLALAGGMPPLSGIDGVLQFSERGITIEGMHAGFLGGRLTADARTGADGAVTVEGRGSATVAALGSAFDEPVLRLLAQHGSGSMQYTGRLVLGGATPLLEVASDLVGVQLDLPPPFAKPAAAALPLKLAHRNGAAVPDEWQVSAGSLLELRLQRTRNARGVLQLARGAIGINEQVALPAQGLRIGIRVDTLDTAAWSELADALMPEAPAAPAAGRRASFVPLVASVRAGELRGAGVTLDQAVVEANRAPDGQWSATLTSTQASGRLGWRPAQGGAEAVLTARLDRLKLPKTGEGEAIAQAAAGPLHSLPALDVTIDDFQLGQTRYGRLELDAVNTGSGATAVWELRRLRVENPDARLSASGAWTPLAGGGGAGRVSLKFDLDIADGGALLERLGSPGLLRRAAGKINGELAWRGEPTRLSYPTLDGKLTLALEQGQFLKADPGAARLLSIISLQGLARRATLDFSSFESGFAFTSITANATLAAGVVSTSDFKMVGPQAAVLIDGNIDLARETQKLRVLVLPDVNLDSASLLYAALVNPAVGLGTFLAQWLLRDPLSKMFSLEYSVTGTWSDPVLQRLNRGPVSGPAVDAQQ